MRLVDLQHDDLHEGVDLATICELMQTIALGQTDQVDFEVREPNHHSVIVYVGGVVLSQCGALAWILHKQRRQNNFFLGLGARREYWECIFYGAPENVRADCLLSLDDAVASLEHIIDGRRLKPPLHWVRQEHAFNRTNVQ